MKQSRTKPQCREHWGQVEVMIQIKHFGCFNYLFIRLKELKYSGKIHVVWPDPSDTGRSLLYIWIINIMTVMMLQSLRLKLMRPVIFFIKIGPNSIFLVFILSTTRSENCSISIKKTLNVDNSLTAEHYGKHLLLIKLWNNANGIKSVTDIYKTE